MLALHILSEGGPNGSLSWLLLWVLVFFFLVVIVGWLTSRNQGGKPDVMHEARESSHHELSHKEADDLVKIEGIGPKVAKVLKDAGIVSFDDLAQAKSSNVQKVLDAAGLHMMNPEGWIDQAKLAAKGDWKAFEKLQSELKGGRRK